MSHAEPSNCEGFVDAMVSAVLDADEADLAQEAALAGEDLDEGWEQLRARFLERVALAHAREAGLEQTVLSEAGAMLAGCREYDQTLSIIGDLVVRHIAEMCIIDMFDPDGARRRLTVKHADPRKRAVCRVLAKLPIELIRRLTRTALESGQPQMLDDIAVHLPASLGQTPEYRRALRELASRSAVVVPLVSGAEVLGVVLMASSRAQRFDSPNIALAIEFARRATLTLENVRRHEAEQRAIRARDEVLGIVAHDLRSPLHSINLAAQLLGRKISKGSGDAKCQDYVSSIIQAVARANRLIQDLLDVSRAEAGALTLTRELMEPKSVIADAVESMQLRATDASIELRLECDDELPTLWADQARLLQVLENLIGNAIKFTPMGGHITVAAARDAEAVKFSVVDTGAGIAEESLTHVFDRFWQAENTARGGAGLGLPICKGIIEAHGGRIWAESTLGCGAMFFFTIPTANATKSLRQESSHPSFPGDGVDGEEPDYGQ